MARNNKFTEAQIEALKGNPFTHSVTADRIIFTVEFKQFFYDQTQIPGMSTRKIMRAAGYDPEWFSKANLSAIRQRVKTQAASPEGFKAPRGMTSAERTAAFAAKDLTRQNTDKTIRELQDRIVHLEAQIEFLKKISRIRNQT